MKPLFSALTCTLFALVVGGCASTGTRQGGSDSGNVPRLAVIDTQLGAGYLRDDKVDLAYKRLHRALELAPNYSVAHNVMGLIEERLNQPGEAEKHFRRAVEINPKDSSAQNNYGAFLCRQGRVEAAEQHFMKAVENPLYDAPESAYTNAGLCLQRAGQGAKAETYLRKALSIDPKLAPALYAMAELRYKSHHPLSARGYLQRYQEVSKNSPQSLWLGIQIERALGDQDAVSSYAMLLKANYPDSEEAQRLRQSEKQ